MKTQLLTLILLLLAQLMLAQGTITYNFQDTLTAENNAGPKLIRLGTGYFKMDTITCSNQVRPVYHFDDNMGLQFDNNLAGNWFKKSYTIELYFKMDELSSWKRVVDYKNRTSDLGCYVYNGKLNFYNIATSDTIPFSPKKYQYYTVTRDSLTKRVRVYSSGSSRIDFIDNGDQALLSSANVLNFFKDDLIVQNEASPGEIALLRLTNSALDSATVKSRFSNICNILTGIGPAINTSKIEIYPNPASQSFSIKIPVQMVAPEVELMDLKGKTIWTKKPESNLNLTGVFPGIYIVRVKSDMEVFIQRLIVK
jgi:OOP family OmpA-OmpF porin